MDIDYGYDIGDLVTFRNGVDVWKVVELDGKYVKLQLVNSSSQISVYHKLIRKM